MILSLLLCENTFGGEQGRWFGDWLKRLCMCVCVFHKHMLDIIKTEILITETSVKQSYFPSLNG